MNLKLILYYYFSKEIVGMPLFCSKSKNWKKDFVIGGIKFKMLQYGHSKHSKNDRRHPNNIETFYNIYGEENWIESVLSEKENNDVIVKWVYVTGKSLSEAIIFASTNPQYDVGLDRTGHLSFLTGQDRTPKFAGQVLPDRTESRLIFLNMLPTT